MVKKITTLVLLLLSVSSGFAQNDTTLLRLYRDADIVVHIRFPNSRFSDLPSFTHDLGTEHYILSFSLIDTYKQRVESIGTHFSLIHTYTQPAISSFLFPGKDYVVFLKSRNVPGRDNYIQGYEIPEMLPGGIVPFTREIDRIFKKIPRATAFDRAVQKGKWNVVKRHIRQHIRREALHHGKNISLSLNHLNTWLRSHATVDAVHGDSCGMHIDIYPGWVDEGIRFLTRDGPQEFNLSMPLGKVRRFSAVYYWVGLHGSRDKLIFGRLREQPGVLEGFRKNCIDMRFQRISNWKHQQDVELSTAIYQDTIHLVAMTSPLIRVKVKLLNRSAGPLNLLWPDKQDDGWEIFIFKMRSEDGSVIREDGEFLEMPPLTSIGPSMIKLAVGDSLVGWHSFNDPYCCDTDPTACHDLAWIPEGNCKIGVTYKPAISGGDTSLYWNPEGGCREKWNEKRVYFQNTEESRELKFKARLIEKNYPYRNIFGQKGQSDALVTVAEVPEGSPFQKGDTIGCRFPVNVHYLMRLPQPRPAMEAELMSFGDLIELEIIANYTADEFRLPTGKLVRNYLLKNSMGAIRRIDE
jgi:hypothetical protein